MAGVKRVAIVNPRSAGGRTGRDLAQVEAALRDTFDGLEIMRTEAPRHAVSLARDAVAAGVEHLVAVGGDGTWHEVVNGVLGEAGTDAPGVILSLIPRGTGGDARRALGIPRSLAAALACAKRGSAARRDLARATWTGDDGRVRREVVTNIASVGMSALAAARTHHGTVTKARLGAFAFLLEGIAVALAPHRYPLRLSVDHGPMQDVDVLLCAIANGHAFGGGMRIAPGARMDDGTLDVTWIEALPRAGVLAFLPLVYPGLHVRLPWVRTHRAHHIHIEPRSGALDVEWDGEVPDPARSLTVEVLPAAIRVTCHR